MNTSHIYAQANGYPEWSLYFEFRLPPFHAQFVVHEPYLHTKEAWLALAEGKIDMYLYRGSGECCIVQGEKVFCFISAPSNPDGDNEANFTVPADLVMAPLKAAIEEAVAEGLKFKE